MLNLIALWVLLIVALMLSGYRYETSKRREIAQRAAADRWHQAMRDAQTRMLAHVEDQQRAMSAEFGDTRLTEAQRARIREAVAHWYGARGEAGAGKDHASRA